MNVSEPLLREEELNAVLHFVQALKTHGKPIQCKESHSLLTKAPAIKKYLKSKWKLNLLEGFFRKYPGYFTVDTNCAVFLQNPDMDVLELDCVRFFVKMMTIDGSAPFRLHMVHAYSLLKFFVTDQTTTMKYTLQELFHFFQRHGDFFHFENNQVSLKCFQEIRETVDVPLSSSPTPSTATSNAEIATTDASVDPCTEKVNRKQKRKARRPSSVSDCEELNSQIQALHVTYTENQWSPENPEGRKQYDRAFLLILQSHPLSLTKPALLHPNLEIVFDTPKLFVLRKHKTWNQVACAQDGDSGEPPHTASDCLTNKIADTSEIKSEPTKLEKQICRKICRQAEEFFKKVLLKSEQISLKDARMFLEDNVDLRDSLKMFYDLENLKPFFGRYPNAFLIVDENVTLKTSTQVDHLQTAGFNLKNKLTELQSQESKINIKYVFEDKTTHTALEPGQLLTNSVSSHGQPCPSTTEEEAGKYVKYQDTACQTMSTGPILSLRFIH